MSLNLIEIQATYQAIHTNMETIAQLSQQKMNTTVDIELYVSQVQEILKAIKEDAEKISDLEELKE